MSDSLHVTGITTLTGPLVDLRQSMDIWLWDLGPEQPDLPNAPPAPSGTEGEPKYDLAKLQYKRALKGYEDDLIAYEKAEADFKAWTKNEGGPIERKFFSCDARDAIVNDLRAFIEKRQTRLRYRVSNRGFGRVAQNLVSFVNGALTNENILDAKGKVMQIEPGLPKGMKPGHGHQASLERQIAGEKEFVAARKADPHFGQEMQR